MKIPLDIAGGLGQAEKQVLVYCTLVHASLQQ